jgi:hypothetical protein
MQKDGERDEGGRIRLERLKHLAGMHKDIALWVELCRLLATFQGSYFWQYHCKQPALIQQVESAHPLRMA